MVRQKLVSWSLFLSLGLWAMSASADIIFDIGNHPQPDEQNILFEGSETGSTITGDADGVPVVFSSLTGQTLYQNAKGQASIEEVDGKLLTSLLISTPGYTFQDFIFNPLNGIGTATVTVVDNFGAVFTYDLGNGENFLTIYAINDETIQSISVMMSAGGGFDVFKQPRISGAVPCPETGCPSPDQGVPEPATLALLGVGIAGMGFARRRKLNL